MRLLGEPEIYDIGDFKGFQKISKASVRDFMVVADPSVYVSVCVCVSGPVA